jgi:hypothetical protein
MGVGEGFVQAGAFFEFFRVHGFILQKCLGGAATGGPQSIDFTGYPGSTADRKRYMTFGNSHAFNLLEPVRNARVRGAEFGLSVCLTKF